MLSIERRFYNKHYRKLFVLQAETTKRELREEVLHLRQ